MLKLHSPPPVWLWVATWYILAKRTQAGVGKGFLGKSAFPDLRSIPCALFLLPRPTWTMAVTGNGVANLPPRNKQKYKRCSMRMEGPEDAGSLRKKTWLEVFLPFSNYFQPSCYVRQIELSPVWLHEQGLAASINDILYVWKLEEKHLWKMELLGMPEINVRRGSKRILLAWPRNPKLRN